VSRHRDHVIVRLEETSGERSPRERSWVVECRCGFEEHAHSRKEARHEHRCHKGRMVMPPVDFAMGCVERNIVRRGAGT
jgi:hypothetical protein